MTIERWLPAVALAVFGALAVAPAGAQSDDELRPVMDRLDRLERDVNLLQRQVYRGGGTGVTAPQAGAAASAGSAIDVEVRLGRLEEQVRGLTGQIEDTTYKIQQLNQRLDRLQTDLDFRLNQLEHPGSAPAAPPSESAAPAPSGSPGRAALAPAPATPPAPDSSSGAPIRLRPPGSAATPPAVTQPSPTPGVLGTVVVPDTEPTRTTTPQTAAIPPQNVTGSPLEQYNAAFALLRQARYDEAEQALRGFIQRNPKDALAGNAQYWLGETYFARKDYGSAASAFAEGYEKYPHSPKAPDDLLKLGITLGILGQKDNACRVYTRLEHDFPQVQTEIRDRTSTEKKRLGCPA